MLPQHRLVKQKQIFGSRKMQLRGVTVGNTDVIVVIPKYSDALTITIKGGRLCPSQGICHTEENPLVTPLQQCRYCLASRKGSPMGKSISSKGKIRKDFPSTTQ